MSITIDQLEGLSKQVFIVDYLLNGRFPCQSDVVRLIRAKKRDWKFNDKFEYHMLLANTNTAGTLEHQVFNKNGCLRKSCGLEYTSYRATYGTVFDGFDVDMMTNLETKDKKATFENSYATRMHMCRKNMVALFKNFAIHGRFGVVHQIRASIDAPTVEAARTPVANVHTPVLGMPFTIKVPINVFKLDFKRGNYLIKTKEATPWGAADVSELYMVLDNQPGILSLMPVGTTVSAWEDGQFLELARNREIDGVPADTFSKWSTDAITVSNGFYQGEYDQFEGTGTYTSGKDAVTGAMEGLADLFAWYTDPADMETRLGLDLPFRGQANRQCYTVEMAGNYVVQDDGEHIIDTIMRGEMLTKATVPYTNIGIWINPVTCKRMAQEEGGNIQVLKENFVAGPIVYQRRIKTTDYQVGNYILKEMVEDLNMPTDVIVIGPKNDISYNCWDNATFETDKYIQETWSKSEPPKIQDLQIPNELLAKMDLSQRITYTPLALQDERHAQTDTENNIRHSEKVVRVTMHEMGALFTEHPYAYTVVKLREPICWP